MATNQLQFQQETITSIQNLELQLSQMTSDWGDWKAQILEELPSQSQTNLKENTSEVTLKSETQFKEPPQRAPKTNDEPNKLCTNVRELRECKVVSEGKSFLEVLQKELPPKL